MTETRLIVARDIEEIRQKINELEAALYSVVTIAVDRKVSTKIMGHPMVHTENDIAALVTLIPPKKGQL